MRAPYWARTVALPTGTPDQLLARAVWAESHGFYAEAYFYLGAALAVDDPQGPRPVLVAGRWRR